jgi:hypothetical protein
MTTPADHLWVMHRRLRLIPVPTTTADTQVVNTECRLIGFTFAETTDSAVAEVQLFDGHDENGVLVAPIKIASGASMLSNCGLSGWPITAGIYLEVLSGSVQGSITIGHLEPLELT